MWSIFFLLEIILFFSYLTSSVAGRSLLQQVDPKRVTAVNGRPDPNLQQAVNQANQRDPRHPIHITISGKKLKQTKKIDQKETHRQLLQKVDPKNITEVNGQIDSRLQQAVDKANKEDPRHPIKVTGIGKQLRGTSQGNDKRTLLQQSQQPSNLLTVTADPRTGLNFQVNPNNVITIGGIQGKSQGSVGAGTNPSTSQSVNPSSQFTRKLEALPVEVSSKLKKAKVNVAVCLKIQDLVKNLCSPSKNQKVNQTIPEDVAKILKATKADLDLRKLVPSIVCPILYNLDKQCHKL